MSIYVHSGSITTFLETDIIEYVPDQLIMLYNYNWDTINMCTLHIKM